MEGSVILRYCKACRTMRPKAGEKANDYVFVCESCDTPAHSGGQAP